MACQVLQACIRDLAAQYKHVKFLTIPSTECIPNYPDENLPTLLVYHGGQCKRTIVGTRTLGVDRISPESEQPLSLMTQLTHASCVSKAARKDLACRHCGLMGLSCFGSLRRSSATM